MCVRYLKKVTAINIHQSLCIQFYQLPEYCTEDMYTCAFIALLVTGSVVGNDWSDRDMPCPPWFRPINSSTCTQMYSHCFCSPYLPFRIMCDQHKFTSYLKLGNCAFQNNATGNTIVGECPYVFPDHLFEDQLLQLPQNIDELNSMICKNLTREVGQSMCGRCVNGTGPSVSSIGSQCVECNALNILYYILLQYLPATIIFLLILLAQIDVTSAPMAHYILYCNTVVIYAKTTGVFFTTFMTSYKYLLRAFLSLNSILSFDPLYYVSPPLCLSTHIEGIDIPYIEMLATLYPFFLLVLAFILIELHARDFKPVVVLFRPLHQKLIHFRRSWNPRASLVQSFATIFFISFTKLLFLIFIPFIHTDFMNQNGKVVKGLKVTSIDPTVSFGHGKHIYLMVFSASILIFIILPPIIVLIAYPTRLFRRLQERFSSRVNLAIGTFVNTFQGCYKDGLNGTRDYRAMSGGILASIVIMVILWCSADMLVEVSDRQPIISKQLTIWSLIALTVMMATLRPYKSETANHTAVCLTALLAAVVTLWILLDTSNNEISYDGIVFIGIPLLSIPHCIFYIYVLYQIRRKVNFKTIVGVCTKCFKSEGRMLEDQALLT